MNPINTVSDYLSMSSRDKKKFVNTILRKANKDQSDLMKRYDEAVSSGEIKPVS